MSESIVLNVDDLTIGDLEDFQEITGSPFDKALRPVVVLDDDGEKVFDEKGRPVKEVEFNPTVLKALVYISKRRDNPEFTLEDARNIKVADFALEGGDEEADPTSAAT